MKFRKILKFSTLIGISIVLILFLYYLKCQDLINLIPSVSLSKVVPFKYLQRAESPMYADDGKAIVNENFDGIRRHGDLDVLWAREKELVSENIEASGRNGSKCIAVKSSSNQDWSVLNSNIMEVAPGHVFYYEGYLKSNGANNKSGFSVILYDDAKQVMQWIYAYKGIGGATDWTKISNKFLVPTGVKFISFRYIGYGKGESFADDLLFKKEELTYSPENLKGEYTISNGQCSFTVNTIKNEASILDKNIGASWVMPGFFGNLFLISTKEPDGSAISIEAVGSEDLSFYTIGIKMQDQERCVYVEINRHDNAGFDGLEFPVFSVSDVDESFVLPIAQGMIMPLKDISESYFSFLSGRPLPFVGLVRGDAGLLIKNDTPVDSEIIIDGQNAGKVMVRTKWLSEKGNFGYSRKVIFQLIEKDGYSGLAKEARRWLSDKGLLKTLSEKAPARNNNMDKLIGAVDVWYFGGKDQHWLIKDMEKAGIKKVLVSSIDNYLDILEVNKIGFLSSQYDIYQDVWSPEYHDLTTRNEGWPKSLVLDEKGDWIKWWVIKKDSKEYPGGVICSIDGLRMAKDKLPIDIKAKPHTARFVDTTTSTPWRECYSKVHPTTRTEDMKNKMELLDFYANNMHIVTGSEDGAYTAIPYCDYFEGMMSPWMGRLPDSGRNVTGKRYAEPTEDFMKYQVGVKYRIPLWELVFHDCAVSTWYWCDSSNLINEVWYRRDLFNILYGNMPLWSIPDWDYWKKYKARFIECYNNVCPVFEKIGYSEMLTHKFITDDHMVQETTFSNNIRIVVNFGEQSYLLKEKNYTLPAHGFAVFENDKLWKEGICS